MNKTQAQTAAAKLRSRLPHGAIKQVAGEFSVSANTVQNHILRHESTPILRRLIELADTYQGRAPQVLDSELAKRMAGDHANSRA